MKGVCDVAGGEHKEGPGSSLEATTGGFDSVPSTLQAAVLLKIAVRLLTESGLRGRLGERRERNRTES